MGMEGKLKALESSSVEEPLKDQQKSNNSNDLKVEIPKFEEKLDQDEFLQWLS